MKKVTDPTRKRYTLCILVQDIPGVLSQVSRLFSRKGYNIESIVSGETEHPDITRISIEILGDELMVGRIAAQCRKLLPVQAVKVLDEQTAIRRQISLIKVSAPDRGARSEIIHLSQVFHAGIVDVGPDSLTVELFGDNSKTAALIRLLNDYGILEIAKTGTIAMERGRSTIYGTNKLKEEYDYGKNVL